MQRSEKVSKSPAIGTACSPLPFKHRQPDPDEGHQEFATEAIWTQFLPLTTTSQYILFWYTAETLPEACEEAYAEGSGGEGRERIYQSPPAFPAGQMLRERDSHWMIERRTAKISSTSHAGIQVREWTRKKSSTKAISYQSMRLAGRSRSR